MSRTLIPIAVITMLMLACGLPSAVTPTPAGTATARPSSTATVTRTPTPRPTASQTPLPSATATEEPMPKVAHTRAQFERMVKAGLIQCLGYDKGGAIQGYRFVEQAYGAGVIPRKQFALAAGIPSLDDPSECMYLVTLTVDAKVFLVYKDGRTSHYVKLPITDAFQGGGQNS